ncbi:hypothetical protein MNBD_GAMMA09-1797 [hydrothermal vent metagenome]|uniref:Uncharacterized protein n=1 Tax=hydrothermal vent metagenome TaxID=652676 RepID=A0A3B0YHB2_9ZZZZ
MTEFYSQYKISDVNKLCDLLKKQKTQYLQHGVVPSTKIYIHFEGKFQGVDVVWHACTQAVDDYSVQSKVLQDPRQFINVYIEEGVYYIGVALNVPLINRVVIEQTIIMIRKYRRLQIGRHEYGARSKTQ